MTELMLILATPNSSLYFAQMDELGMLEIIFPAIIPMKGCDQNGFHHKDVWGHSLLVMQHAEHIINNLDDYFGEKSEDISYNLAQADRLPLLKLAALMHDIGKPGTKETDPGTGRISFHNHAAKGAAMIEVLARAMKMSRENINFLARLTAEHLNILTLASGRARPLTQLRWFRKMHDDSIPAIILSMADIMSILGPDAGEEYRQNHINWSKKNIIDYCENIKTQIEKKPLITGSDLIALGMEPGPGIGKVLRQVRDAQDTAEVTTRQAALDLARSLAGRTS
jgi:putative nucleotidyltransferase with HDIG domain